MYDPSFKDKKNFLERARAHAPAAPLSAALVVRLRFLMPRPKAHFRTGKFANVLKPKAPALHTRTPDTDNMAKFVLDALNRVFYVDDSQIIRIECEKAYGAEDDENVRIGRTDVEIFEVGVEEAGRNEDEDEQDAGAEMEPAMDDDDLEAWIQETEQEERKKSSGGGCSPAR